LFLLEEYVFGKQTISQLSHRYGLSASTITRKLSSAFVPTLIPSVSNVIVLVDTTYWGRNFGLVVFKDYRTKMVLWYKFVRYETIADYKEGFAWLVSQDFQIDAIVCDGLRGMFQLLSDYRVQMCQYHQLRIV
jgi:hypothetical protein